MKNRFVSGLILLGTFFLSSQLFAGNILKVPSEYSTIAEAVEKSTDGDTIIIAPGKYKEKNIELTKAITITSEWKQSGDENTIEQTIIDSDKDKLFMIKKDGIEISGLRIINGDHTLEVAAKAKIIHNHLSGNLDAISMEAGAGGYVGYNTMENDIDDGLDIDIGDDSKNAIGSDVTIEYNTIINSHDDGMEIRLFSRPDQNVTYTIRRNTIIGSGNAGVQLISYDVPTGKVFYISENIFKDCKTALGCMEGAKTGENLEGASMMNEPVYFFNNTITGNRMGATGGNVIYAFNNLVINNEEGGFKRFGKNSIVQNNIFYNNGGPDFIELSPDAIVKDNSQDADPKINLMDFSLSEGSPAIDAGLQELIVNGETIVTIPSENISGAAPDQGAIEKGWKGETAPVVIPILTDAGNDIVSKDKIIELSGSLKGDADNPEILWVKEAGPGKVKISGAKKLSATAKFNQHGIYRLALTAAKRNLNVKDQITVRYINSGSGKEFFAGEGEAFELEAEDHTYSYGLVTPLTDHAKAGNSFVKMNSTEGESSMLEFSMGMESTDFYTLWIRYKSAGENSISVHFNGKHITQFSAPPCDAYRWIKAEPEIRATSGQWSMLLKLESGVVEIDKIILTPDKDFIAK